jgi:predicted SPOUT superfamily RNA methylase MTH1
VARLGELTAGGAPQRWQPHLAARRSCFTRFPFPPHSSPPPTLSLILPGSAIDNAQGADRATALAGALARAAAVFCVDEVIVLDDGERRGYEQKSFGWRGGLGPMRERERAAPTPNLLFSHASLFPSHSPPGAPGPGAALLARILQYQETPQYLRRRLIPVHSDLRAAGALPPLDAPHHARAGEWVAWREGCVLASARGLGSVVDVGLDVVSFL